MRSYKPNKKQKEVILKFKIFSQKENRPLTDSEVAHLRLAIFTNGKVYSGTYDCIVDGYEVFQFTNNLDANGEEVYDGDLLYDKSSIIKVVRAGHGGFWPFTETYDYLYNGAYKDMVLYRGPKRREYILGKAFQESSKNGNVFMVSHNGYSVLVDFDRNEARLTINKKEIFLRNIETEGLVERFDERIIGELIVLTDLNIVPPDIKISGDLEFEVF